MLGFIGVPQETMGTSFPSVTSVIPGGGTTSPDWIDVRGFIPLFVTDTDFTGTDITFLHSLDGINSAGVLLDSAGDPITLVGVTATIQTICPTDCEAVALSSAYFIKVVKTTVQGGGTPTTIIVGKSS